MMVILRLFTIYALVFLFVLHGETTVYKASSEGWMVLENYKGENFPVSGLWQPKKFEGEFIVPEFKGKSPELKNFIIHPNAFPKSFEVAIGPPTDVPYRIEEKSLSRFTEHISEKAFETDNNLEYIIYFEGQWGLDNRFTNEQNLYEFISGSDNWIEVVSNNVLLGSGRGKVVMSGADFPKSGEGVIRISSIARNNTGLMGARVYGVYEEFVPDPFHKAINDNWLEKSKTLKWLKPTTKNIRLAIWQPEDTPSLYRRTYICKEGEAEGVYFSTSNYVTHLWINGQGIDLNNKIIPSGILKVGENEVIYYSSQINNGLNDNLELFAVTPYWVKKSVQATKNSVLSAMLRGAKGGVYINGKFAGVLNPEKSDEYLGYGLFKDGENEVVLELKQHQPYMFLEYLQIDTLNEKMALVLPWKGKGGNLLNSGSVKGSSYNSYYLQEKAGDDLFESSFFGQITEDMELIFDSGKRFPEWMFKNDLTIPNKILFNGEVLYRQGNSFLLPAKLSKEENKISFAHRYGALPEPLLYKTAAIKGTEKLSFKQIGRTGKERLKPGVYFVGEKLTYYVGVDFSVYSQVIVNVDDQKFILNKENATEVTFEFKKSGEHKLLLELTKKNQVSTIEGDRFYVIDFPVDKNKWLKENIFCGEILVTSEAFYGSESTLFPEFYQKEWVQREVKSDSGSLEFGGLALSAGKEKFSIFDSFPNGLPVFEKFGRRMETYMKLRSRGYPMIFRLEMNFSAEELWKSAAVVFHYLTWLEAQNVKVDWTLETLEDYKLKYVEGMKEKATEFITFRREQVVDMLRRLSLHVAPKSILKEKK